MVSSLHSDAVAVYAWAKKNVAVIAATAITLPSPLTYTTTLILSTAINQKLESNFIVV